MLKRVVMWAVLTICGVAPVFAWEANLRWDDFTNDPEVLSGYYLYYRRPALGEATYTSINRIDVGDDLLFLVTGMQYGTEYCFVVTAYAVTPQMESEYSTELCVEPAPTVTISNPVAGSSVSGIQLIRVVVSDRDDEVGVQNVTLEINTNGTWIPMEWNMGSQCYEVNWDTTSYTSQPITLTAIAVDPTGFISDAVSTFVTVDNRLHVGDLDGSAVSGSPWTATVRVQVHDKSHAPIPSMTVKGSWSNASSGTTSCITDGTGWCSVTANIPKNKAQTKFTVSGIQPGSYQKGANHDLDGESNGTAITVSRP